MRRLRTHVHVPDGLDWRVFGPGDEVPDEFAALITNPKAWEDTADPVSTVPEPSGGDSDDTSDTDPPGDVPYPVSTSRSEGVPPKSGHGSGRDPWAAYASDHGVHVEISDTRADIIAALDTAGVPTE